MHVGPSTPPISVQLGAILGRKRPQDGDHGSRYLVGSGSDSLSSGWRRPPTRLPCLPAQPRRRRPAASCTQVSKSIHSRYERSLSDLPSDGRAVQIKIRVRRFRCSQADCPRRVFAERLEPAVSTAFSRRTERLEGIVHHLGLALGGRPGQSFARRLIIPVSKDTLLRVVRRRTADPTSAPKVVGIDDWAWKRGHRYGTIICDLEQRRIIDILPDREASTVTRWLAEHPSITIIARDRGAGFVQAATPGPT